VLHSLYSHKWIRVFACGLAATLLVAAIQPTVRAEFFPERGDWCYSSGANQAFTLFQFANPGPFQVPFSMFNPGNVLNDPGFELDFAIEPGFYNACVTGTDLPDPYDDCPTVGILESGFNAFSFGTYTANAITPGRVYQGIWLFSGPRTIAQARFEFRGQEVFHAICPVDSPFCLEVNRNKRLYRSPVPNDGLLNNPNGGFSCRAFNYL